MSDEFVYFNREVLTFSKENRKVELLTITSKNGSNNETEKRLQNLFPENKERSLAFPRKKYVLFSSRVHPGEIPSSHMLNGLLKYLTQTDQE